MFTPRLTKPEKGNPYYNTKSNGGYSTAIKGSPIDPDCDVLSNCVGYAVGRFNEIVGKEFPYFAYPPNAENLYALAVTYGLQTGQTPKRGALMIWAKGIAGVSADGAGHVAVVEQINADGSIVTSESGWNASRPFWTQTRTKGSGNWGQASGYTFLGFVYNPAVPEESVCPYATPTAPVRLGDTGDAVRWVQWQLIQRGYLRDTELDGDFGTITLGALLAFQFEHDLELDGVCGSITRQTLSAH